MNLVETKVLVAVLLMLLRFLFGILPVKVYYFLLNWGEEGSSKENIEERHQSAECAIARIQSFGGGVLFATCFLHMIPEVRKSVRELLASFNDDFTNDDLDCFPLSELIISIGFFMVYFIEEFTHWYVHNVHNENKTTPISPITIVEQDKTMSSTYNNNITYIDIDQELENENYPQLENNHVHQQMNGNHFQHETPCKNHLVGNYLHTNHKKRKTSSIIRSINSHGSNLTLHDDKDLDSDSSSDEVIIKSAKRITSAKNSATLAEEKQMKTSMKEKQKNIRGFLVVLALSVHSIFEGLSIGLQKSASNIWYMFIAISIHASTILYCIGFEMAVEGVKTSTIVIHMIVLAVVSPFGVIIGLLFTVKSDMDTKGKTVAVCVLEGISAGTVLYITFFEVLHREKNRRHHRISRSIFMLAGFGIMIALQLIDV